MAKKTLKATVVPSEPVVPLHPKAIENQAVEQFYRHLGTAISQYDFEKARLIKRLTDGEDIVYVMGWELGGFASVRKTSVLADYVWKWLMHEPPATLSELVGVLKKAQAELTDSAMSQATSNHRSTSPESNLIEDAERAATFSFIAHGSYGLNLTAWIWTLEAFGKEQAKAEAWYAAPEMQEAVA